MSITQRPSRIGVARRPAALAPRRSAPEARPQAAPRRIASNFAALTLAEIACRGISVAATIYLAKVLGKAGFGRVEFAFNLVFWLVLLVREGVDLIASREIARHPRIVRPLVNHILAIRGMVALVLLTGLLAVGWLAYSDPVDQAVLGCYGLMLVTTAMGLDFVYRGLERMWLVAFSLAVRTAIYAVGIALVVSDPSRLVWVPVCLVTGEAIGILMIWGRYLREFGIPRPMIRGGSHRLAVFSERIRPVYLIRVSLAVIGSADLLVVGVMSQWADTGCYSAPHRMVTALLTFGLIFQQVVFPSMARSWRTDAATGRKEINALVRVLMLGMVPVTLGVMVLAQPLVACLLPAEYADAALLLALGIWRAPLLTLASLYQTSLIALNRADSGVRLLLAGAIGSGPLVALARWSMGLPGAAVAMIVTGLALVVAGHRLLAEHGRAPAWHHHAFRPLLASVPMVLVCVGLYHQPVPWTILLAGSVYVATLAAIGGLGRDDLANLVCQVNP